MSAPSTPLAEQVSTLSRLARENPTRTLLVAIGLGLAVGVLVRALQPRPSENGATRLLADIQERLHDIAGPVRRHADHVVESGASTVRNGVAQLHDLRLDRGLRQLGRRLKSLFR